MYLRLLYALVLPIQEATAWILTAQTSRTRWLSGAYEKSFMTLSGAPTLWMSQGENDGSTEESLLLSGEAIQQQMAQLRAKYPTSESAFLAAARARNAAKPESVNSQANDDDWKSVAAEQRAKYGDGGIVDDWENSAAEAGSMESQILIPQIPNDDDDNEEPKLLLF
jgi:hypothetical protein